MEEKEFVEVGYLQELNRRILHPLGLALEVVVEEDGTQRFGGIWDYRDDPEGILFDPSAMDPEKAQRVQDVISKRFSDRITLLGYWVQPLK